MAKGLIKDSTLTAIANAIREKTETTATMLPSEMAALIQGITGAKFAWGSVTFSSYNAPTTQEITHNIGEIPNLIMFFLAGNTINENMTISIFLNPDGTGGRFCYYGSGKAQYSNFGANLISAYFPNINDATFTVKPIYGFGTCHYWVAGVVEV